jgi:hypothetical protein
VNTALARTGMKASTIEGLLASRRDSRSDAGPVAGLDQSGCSVRPRRDIVELGSCTATTIGAHGWGAATIAVDTLRAQGARSLATRIRRSLASCLELPSDTAIALSPSGTAAMYIISTLARARWRRPWRTVLVGRGELGSGVPLAAHGRHFSAHAPFATVTAGAPAMGAPAAVHAVRVRDSAGVRRAPEAIHEDIERLSLEGAGPVLLHTVEHGETGVRAPDESVLDALAASAPHVAVSVDATQGRVGPETIRRHLARQRAVIVTGSKFFGGPASCGALLLPPSWIGGLIDSRELAPYATQADLPWPTRGLEPHNVGLLLRWSVACAEMERYGAIPPARQEAAFRAFGAAVRRMAERFDLRLEPSPPRTGHAPVEANQSVFCVEVPRGVNASDRWLDLLQVRDGRGFHLGKPHEIGLGRWVLRVACSAPLIAEIAAGERGDLQSNLELLGPRLRGRDAGGPRS